MSGHHGVVRVIRNSCIYRFNSHLLDKHVQLRVKTSKRFKHLPITALEVICRPPITHWSFSAHAERLKSENIIIQSINQSQLSGKYVPFNSQSLFSFVGKLIFSRCTSCNLLHTESFLLPCISIHSNLSSKTGKKTYLSLWRMLSGHYSSTCHCF